MPLVGKVVGAQLGGVVPKSSARLVMIYRVTLYHKMVCTHRAHPIKNKAVAALPSRGVATKARNNEVTTCSLTY